MYASCQYYSFTNGYFFWRAAKICYNQHVYVITGETFAKHGLSDLVLILICASLIHVPDQIRIRIRITMCNVNCVKVKLGCVLEGQAIIILTVPVIVWLQGVDILIEDLERTEFFVATEGRGVLVFKASFCTVCLIICNVLTITLPPISTSFSCVQYGINYGFHTLCICRIWFHEVNYIESICLSLTCILYSKVKPLGKALGAIVVF